MRLEKMLIAWPWYVKFTPRKHTRRHVARSSVKLMVRRVVLLATLAYSDWPKVGSSLGFGLCGATKVSVNGIPLGYAKYGWCVHTMG